MPWKLQLFAEQQARTGFFLGKFVYNTCPGLNSYPFPLKPCSVDSHVKSAADSLFRIVDLSLQYFLGTENQFSRGLFEYNDCPVVSPGPSILLMGSIDARFDYAADSLFRITT